MTLKIKRPRDKIQRRGDRLIRADRHGQRFVYMRYDDGPYVRIVEAFRNGEHLKITYDPTSEWMKAVGHNKDGPVQFIKRDNIFSKDTIAFREDDEDFWTFFDPGGALVSMSNVPFDNLALAASTYEACLPKSLADWLGIMPHLCRAEKIISIAQNPRFRRLMDFQFEFDEPSERLPACRRIENELRHQRSNYDDMLREGAADTGGVMFPEEYAILRKGVDKIVSQYLIKPKAPEEP